MNLRYLNARDSFFCWRTFLASVKIIPKDHFCVTTNSFLPVHLPHTHLFPVSKARKAAFVVRSRKTNMASIVSPFIIFLTRHYWLLISEVVKISSSTQISFFSNIPSISSTYYHLMVVCQRAAQY